MKSFFLSVAAIGLIVSSSHVVAQISVTECEAQIVANKNFQILKGKLDLLHTENPPIEILANSKFPSKKEKTAISLWVEEQKRCSAPGIAYHKSRSAEIGALYDQAYSEMYISAADLYQGKITYGDFAKAGVRRHQELKERISVVVTRFFEQKAERERQETIAREQKEQQQRALAEREQQRREQAQREADYLNQRNLAIYQQQQQQRSQSCEISRQQCLNRARDIYMQNACQMESAGCGIANSMMR